jgi:hypothetical protein
MELLLTLCAFAAIFAVMRGQPKADDGGDDAPKLESLEESMKRINDYQQRVEDSYRKQAIDNRAREIQLDMVERLKSRESNSEDTTGEL